MYLIYNKPNPQIQEDLLAIREIQSSESAVDGISKRIKAVRSFIDKWQDRLSIGFMELTRALLKYEVKTLEGKPAPPNANAYNMMEVGEVSRYVNDVQDAFRRLDEYYTLKKELAEKGATDPTDDFIKMTTELNVLMARCNPHENTKMFIYETEYNLIPNEDGVAFCKIFERHEERVKEIVSKGGDREDLKRFSITDIPPVTKKAEKPKTEDKQKAKPKVPEKEPEADKDESNDGIPEQKAKKK